MTPQYPVFKAASLPDFQNGNDIDQGITKCDDLSESLIDSFLDVYCKDLRTTSAFYSPRPNAQALLKRLFVYLIEIKAFNSPRPKATRKPYSWILDPYLRHLRDECDLSEVTIQRASMQVAHSSRPLGNVSDAIVSMLCTLRESKATSRSISRVAKKILPLWLELSVNFFNTARHTDTRAPIFRV